MIYLIIICVIIICINVFALIMNSKYSLAQKLYDKCDFIYREGKHDGNEVAFKFNYRYMKSLQWIEADMKIIREYELGDYSAESKTYLVYVNDSYLGALKQSNIVYILDDDFTVHKTIVDGKYYASQSIDNNLFKRVVKYAFRSFVITLNDEG